ncbi:HAD family hydrolase [Tengunoibacter tsumagoiensis]|uniref:Haloacid dehalogenase n=1 Tax=Tengunoibacter tsumagoiensis TaxID=2014871 RepID=A0A401ZYC7_9CHLR|nr:HAD family hydrolase [Tengunoibacter tsumagoiensis]GCE11868.1 haloacid dehalogenase [Tengunoibacter tsumagoiensis]
MQQQYLIIDADDTLWENNIYFEQVTHNFIEFLNHSTLTPVQIRAVLSEVEREMVAYGYGTASYIRSLQATYHRLSEREISDKDLQQIAAFADLILHAPMELLPGVEETLAILQPRQHLLLLTKGNTQEQELKIERSGLKDYFEHVRVVPEKNVSTYLHLIEELSLDPAITWMIGNSPRSDINPAQAAGLHAIYIPHPHTWQLEHEELQPQGSGQLLTIQSFRELREHF